MDEKQDGMYVMGVVEAHFADLIWQHEPIPSGELVKLAAVELQWKKSTTYTVLRKLCEKGIFSNEGSIVTARLSKAEYEGRQSRRFVQENFEGSLPRFLAAFAGSDRLSEEEVAALRRLIAENGGDPNE